jgi:hypothetical protein
MTFLTGQRVQDVLHATFQDWTRGLWDSLQVQRQVKLYVDEQDTE